MNLYNLYSRSDKVETGNEIVCRRCGTLNDERSLMCMRCGEMLEMTEEKKYEIFKGKMMSEKTLIFLFIILFTAYSFGIIFHAAPWIYSKLLSFGQTYIFNFYNNANLTYITLETMYTIFLVIINSIMFSLLIDIIINSKLIKRLTANSTCIIIFIYMILCFVSMTIYKHNLNYVIILEHLVSIIIIFPYVRKKIFRRSI